MNYLLFYNGKIPDYYKFTVNSILSVDAEANIFFCGSSILNHKEIDFSHTEDIVSTLTNEIIDLNIYKDTSYEFKENRLWSDSLLRVFYINDLAKNMNIEEFVHFDLDVIIYKSFSDLKHLFNPEKINSYENTKEYNYFKNFVNDHNLLVPYRTEWNVFHEDHKISGSIDMTFLNDDGTISIYDWKRCKKIEKNNNFEKRCLVNGLHHIHDTNYWHYCFQLNIYKYILEKKYDKKVKDLYLVVIHPDNITNNYEKLKLPILPEKDILTLITHMKI